MAKLAEAKVQLEVAKSAMEIAYAAAPACPSVSDADRAFVRTEISTNLKKLPEMYQKIGRLSPSVNPISIQQIAPDFEELLRNMTELARKAQLLAAKCPGCPINNVEQCEIFGQEQCEEAKS